MKCRGNSLLLMKNKLIATIFLLKIIFCATFEDGRHKMSDETSREFVPKNYTEFDPGECSENKDISDLMLDNDQIIFLHYNKQ